LKSVILSGGLGTRLSEEFCPKPMVEIGARPILSLILKLYSHRGTKYFIVCWAINGLTSLRVPEK
jgi:glucose-1-phosphate cytidylyltransferase